MTSAAALKRVDRKTSLLLVLVLLVIYGMLQSGRWAPANDSELYLALARNIATGKGYLFNGLPVVMIPPGWPLVLAGALKICGAFWFLNLMPMVCLLVTSVLWFRILRRYAPPGRAFLIVLVCATLFNWYSLTFILYSDALFCLIFSAALLVALQINEGEAAAWRTAALTFLCVMMVALRGAGILAWAVPAAALVTGGGRPRPNRKWLALGVSAAATITVFFALRYGLEERARRAPPPPQSARARRPPTTGPASPAPVELTRAETVLRRHYRISIATKTPSIHVRYASSAGTWLARLFWRPAEFAGCSKALAIAVNLAGWLLILVYLTHVIRKLPGRQWVWLGALLYCGALCAWWYRPVVRYFVPVAPLLLLGISQAMRHPWPPFGSRVCRKIGRLSEATLLVTIIGCNGALLAVDVWIARSRDFYGAYHAGRYKQIIAIASHLNRSGIEDGEAAVSYYYLNLGRKGTNSFGARCTNMLTGRTVRMVPPKVCWNEPNDKLLEWCRREGVRFYIRLLPTIPWRVWHFRIPWLQQNTPGLEAGTPGDYWELYELIAGEFVKVEFAQVKDWPRSVPGL